MRLRHLSPFSSHTFPFISFFFRALAFLDFSLLRFEFLLFHCLFAAHVICNNFPNMHHSSASATFVRTSNIFSVLPFVRTCTICLHMQHLTAPAQFYRLRSDFLLPPQATAIVYPGRPRPALATPMAWHYSWHHIFFSLAVSCFFLHFPSDAISSSTY